MSVVGLVEDLAGHLGLSGLLAELRERCGGYELVNHWSQGEFHHDVVLRPHGTDAVLVVSTNCNGGVKEVIALPELPQRWALWHWRCPDNPEFEGELPRILARATTLHHEPQTATTSHSCRGPLAAYFPG